MPRRVVACLIGLCAAVCLSATTSAAADDGTVSTYLHDGWDIKAVSQVSSTGRTQLILQKGRDGVVCTIYFSAVDKGWVPKDAIRFPNGHGATDFSL